MKRKISIYVLDTFCDDLCEEIHEEGTLATLCALLYLCISKRALSSRYKFKILFG